MNLIDTETDTDKKRWKAALNIGSLSLSPKEGVRVAK